MEARLTTTELETRHNWIYNVYTKGGVCMQAQVKKWGNSQGIRISKEILQEANISLDEVLDVEVSDGRITLVKPFRHRTLEERAAEFGGKLSLDGEFDFGEPVGREIW
jgi:antitoxin MazE